MYPKELEPVLALIGNQGDLGVQKWAEVVYWDGTSWNSYGRQFVHGAKVKAWCYIEEIRPSTFKKL